MNSGVVILKGHPGGVNPKGHPGRVNPKGHPGKVNPKGHPGRVNPKGHPVERHLVANLKSTPLQHPQANANPNSPVGPILSPQMKSQATPSQRVSCQSRTIMSEAHFYTWLSGTK